MIAILELQSVLCPVRIISKENVCIYNLYSSTFLQYTKIYGHAKTSILENLMLIQHNFLHLYSHQDRIIPVWTSILAFSLLCTELILGSVLVFAPIVSISAQLQFRI